MTSPQKLPNADLDILIVGAGFSGLYALHKLRQAGFSVKIFESAPTSGGVWHWNCYPGCRTDSDYDVYQYSLEEIWKNWTWRERFPSQPELVEYFTFVEKNLDLTRDILFNTHVTDARFDDTTNRWIVSTKNGTTAHPQFLILCTGFAFKPLFPDYKGLDTFDGIKHHTAQWPQEGVDLQGKRIGVIGTGASSVQIIQENGPHASHLTVFQRTPNLALPMCQRKLNITTQEKLKRNLYPIIFRRSKQTFAGAPYEPNTQDIQSTTPEERRLFYEDLWTKGGCNFWGANYVAYFSDLSVNDEVYAFWKMKVRERLLDSEMQRKLAPDVPPHPFGIKRPSLEQTYYEVFNLPHVALVDIQENPITEIMPRGVKTADGVEHELDVLVLATGFDMVTGSMSQIAVEGTDGVMIGDKLKEGVSTYLGLGAAKFPNMFFVAGPHGPSDLANGPTGSEIQCDWVVECLKHLRDHRISRIEVEEEAQKEFTASVATMFAAGLWLKAKSSYTGANVPGKKIESLNFPGGLPLYMKMCRESAENGYKGFVLTVSGSKVN